MIFDMEALPALDCYKILTATVTPRPIAWITSRSAAGVVNAAPYSFFNMMGDAPPIVVIGIMKNGAEQFKDTAANILETGEFVVNLVSEDLAAAMNVTCMDAPPEVDELVCAGLTTLPSVKVAPPRIGDSPVSLECVTYQAIDTGPGQVIVLGRVVAAHVRDEFVLDAERCHIDTSALKLIARMHGGGWYARSSDLFEMPRQSYAEWLASSGA